MKYILAVVLCMVIGVVNSLIDPSEFGPKLKKLAVTLHDTCVERTKLQPEIFEELMELKFPENDEAKKYVACVWLESTVVDENLKVNEELLLALAPERIKGYIVGVSKDCFAKETDDKEYNEKFYSATKCIFASTNGAFIVI